MSGTQHFLPSLLAQVRSTAPGFPLEPVIIQVLLLSLISGDRHLILRTRDEDITLVSKLTTLVGTLAATYIHRLVSPSNSHCNPGPEHNFWSQHSQIQVPFQERESVTVRFPAVPVLFCIRHSASGQCFKLLVIQKQEQT